MSDGSNSDDSIEQILNKFDSPKVETKQKQLATASKPRAAAPRERSDSIEDGEDEGVSRDTAAKAPSSAFSGLKPPMQAPALGLDKIPITSRPKTNPNSSLLFGDEKKGVTGTKNSVKAPPRPEPAPKPSENPFKAPFSVKGSNTNPSGKGDSDWLGSGNGIESPFGSTNVTPNPQRKIPTGDPFTFGEKESSTKRSQMTDGDVNMLNALNKIKPKSVAEPEFGPPKMSHEKPVVPKPSDFSADSGLPSFLEKLTSSAPRNVSNAAPEGSSVSHNQNPGPDEGQRKKVVMVRKPGPSAPGVTLQVPSHVIDEDELKRMSSSLKLLYENQIEMLEKSYKEQMDCLVQSYTRKEDLLKDEIKMMHKDYEERIGRIRAELTEAETKPLQSRAQASEYFTSVSTISDQLRSLQAQTEILMSQSKVRAPSDSFKEDLSRILDDKLTKFLSAFHTSVKEEVGDTARVGPTLDKIMSRVDGITSELQKQTKINLQDPRKDESAKKLDTEVHKIIKEQKKLRETLLKSTVTTMTQSLETKHDDNRKKEKISTQIREFRRDFQRLTNDFEHKQDFLQRSQGNIEAEQKHISQSFHELSTWLQVNWSHHHQQKQPLSPMQNQSQSSVQNEMELRLLKEERNALSEAIAEMNVSKRRLNDEKNQLETEKRDFERQRLQVHDLETTLRLKISDAEESKKQAEAFRTEHIKLTAELSKKMSEIEKERIRYQEMSQRSELQAGLEKQRNLEEKAEIEREKQFLEKLRLQLLCPACLRLVRSSGDGVDTVPVKIPHSAVAEKAREIHRSIPNYY